MDKKHAKKIKRNKKKKKEKKQAQEQTQQMRKQMNMFDRMPKVCSACEKEFPKTRFLIHLSQLYKLEEFLVE